MSANVPAVLLAAGGVGLAHSVLPDHWVPLAVLARTRRDPLPKVARLSLLAGTAHVVVSVALGAVIIAVGLSVRSQIADKTDLVVGTVLVLTGVAFLISEATGRGHAATHHHGDGSDPSDPATDRGHDHHHNRDRQDHASGHSHLPKRLSILVPFGAAASPDLTILPVFLAAAALGTGPALGSLAVFSVVTLATFVGLTTLAAAGGHQLKSPLIDRYANLITAVVLIIIGALIAAHVL